MESLTVEEQFRSRAYNELAGPAKEQAEVSSARL